MSEFRARVIVASNRAAARVYADTSGPALVDGLRGIGATVGDPVVVPDGEPVEGALRDAIDDRVDVVLTSGGTGVSPTDRTPEMTARVLDYDVPGIAEAVRVFGAAKVPTAALSRGIAGVAGSTLIVNLAGSRGAAADGLAVLSAILPHAVAQLRGNDHPSSPTAPIPHDHTGAATADASTDAGPAVPETTPHDHAGVVGADASTDFRSVATTATPRGSSDIREGSRRPLVKPDWHGARVAVHAAGAGAPEPLRLPLSDVDGCTLAEPLRTRTALPAFPTSSVDGYAVAGDGPWRLSGRVLAGQLPAPLRPGAAIEIATGAMVPAGAEQVIRLEDATTNPDGTVTGRPRKPTPEWREPGEEAAEGEELLPAGAPVTPGVIGIAAHCGHDTLLVRRPPRAAVLVFGDELATSGLPGPGQVRDSLGPQVPGWLARIGAVPTVSGRLAPVADTLAAHVDAIRTAAASAELICTTGGTMRGPVDHLHPALAELGAEYIVDTVAVRPGYPMLLAKLPGGRFLAGLPGNPQSALIGLLTLVWPLVAGLTGRELPDLRRVPLGADVPGRGGDTHLALARISADGLAYPLPHTGSSMLRGAARADGFVVVPPNGAGRVGESVELQPFPLRPGERP